MKWLCLIFLFVAPLTSPSTGELRFSDRRNRDGNEFFLKGQGIIKWMRIVKINATALFLLPSAEPSQVLDDIPKCLEFDYFREISAKDFRDMTRVWMHKNATENEFQSVQETLEAYNQLYRDISPGDRYLIYYNPANKLELYYNDKSLGSVPGDSLFARLLFSIWFGKKPVDPRLKKAILNTSNTNPDKEP